MSNLRGFSLSPIGAAGASAIASLVLVLAGCTAPPAGAPAPSAQSTPGGAGTLGSANATPPVVALIEPVSGAFSGHIDVFSWSPIDGADGYTMRLTAAADGRTVWESARLTATETHLPASVSLEPEAYFWQVTALRDGAALAVSAQSKFTVTP